MAAKSLQQRFADSVDRSGGPTACHEWAAGRIPKGYGRFTRRGAHHYAHRTAWQLSNGPIPAGLLVLHRCDNPPCCNPLHLFLGTHTDNARDREAKGRGWRTKGENHPRAKLTWDDVYCIRSLRGQRTQRSLAAEYGVSQFTIWKIQTGKSWKGNPP